jgi:hypothetical protein
VVRLATAADAEAIAALLAQLGYPAAAADIPGRLARLRRFAAAPTARRSLPRAAVPSSAW